MYKSTQYDFDVIVIGGGASGMMSAGTSAHLGKKVLLVEKNNDLGKKLKITGGGRCNITNAEFDNKILLKNYGAAEKFLYSSFSKFGVKETFTFFENNGLPLIIEPGKRAFPKTQNAQDVLSLFKRYLKESNVVIKTNSPVSKIHKENNNITGIEIFNKIYTANSYILATGGTSHKETGSTGDGFKWLSQLGHKIQNPTGAVVPLRVKESWVKSLSGISVESMKITFFVDNVKNFSKKGRILFTHFGLSGPLILNCAGTINNLLPTGIVTAKIDLYPNIDESVLENKIIKLFENNKNKMLKNILNELVPNGAESVIMSLFKNINVDIKVHSVTKENRKNIIFTLKNLPVTIQGLMGLDRAVVTDGGVDFSEIDTKTMRSNIINNLFITGDLLHINRKSGGFSLQICWTTGYIAGINA